MGWTGREEETSGVGRKQVGGESNVGRKGVGGESSFGRKGGGREWAG